MDWGRDKAFSAACDNFFFFVCGIFSVTLHIFFIQPAHHLDHSKPLDLMISLQNEVEKHIQSRPAAEETHCLQWFNLILNISHQFLLLSLVFQHYGT